jgi:hypothetical protein
VEVYKGNAMMKYKGYVKGDMVILKEPLPVPDGTEVEIVLLPAKEGKNTERARSSVAQETFGMMRSDPTLVRAVLEEDMYEA